MSRAYHLLRKYGITEGQYDEILRNQSGCCGVCKRPTSQFKSRLAIDHDHATGEIRGLLCPNCNRWIVGRHRLGKGELLLLAAYEYLIKQYTGWVVPAKKKKKRRKCRKKVKKEL